MTYYLSRLLPMAAAALICAGPASALEPPHYLVEHTTDVRKFDIDGVRLYMTPEETSAALRARFGSAIKISPDRSQSAFRSGATFVSAVTYRDKQYDLTVEFAEPTPDTASREPVAYRVAIELRHDMVSEFDARGSAGHENYEKLDEEVLQKYGPPDWRGQRKVDGLPHDPDMWCGTSAEVMTPSSVPGYPCAYGRPFMTEGSGGLAIEDYMLGERARAYLAAHSRSSAEVPPL